MAKRKITDELRFLKARIAKLQRMERTEESLNDENIDEAFEQSGNEVDGPAFIDSLESDVISEGNEELPLTGRQQLKEFREKFVKMENELKESRHLNKISKLEQQNKELREKIKHCGLVAELNVLQEKVAKIGEEKQREKELTKYEKISEMIKHQKQSSSKTKTEKTPVDDFEAIFGRIGEDEKKAATKGKYGKRIYTKDTWMFESTSAFFQILSDWVGRAKAASSDTTAQAEIELTEQTFADCREAIKALGIFSNTDPKVLLRRWRSGYRKRHPEATAQVQCGVFVIDGEQMDEQENRTRRQRREPPEKLAVGQRKDQKTLLDRIDELESQLKSLQQEQEDETSKYVPVELFNEMQNEHNELLEKFNALERQLKELQQNMTNESGGESVSGSARTQGHFTRKGKGDLLMGKENLLEQVQSNFRQNSWDGNNCQNDIKIKDGTSLTVHCKGNAWVFRSIFAMHSILLNNNSSHIFYYEISLKNMKGWDFFGFAIKQQQTPKDETIRYRTGTYAYEKNGELWTNGKKKEGNAGYSYGVGDTVGIGVNLSSRRIIFTKNGRQMDNSELMASSSSADSFFFPFVTLSLNGAGDKIEANFGPNFRFDLVTL
ncbi:hypothetical protein niasHS_005201 [Heterodera schachtii]|uniref:B30.2/SPRY domain-containing protein n=1 Tax=Heterodera schachtii TaxID=97005 RepID=A0ABD2JY51_HETSC